MGARRRGSAAANGPRGRIRRPARLGGGKAVELRKRTGETFLALALLAVLHHRDAREQTAREAQERK